MFGDYFGQRGDYEKGLFYAGRRKFLSKNELPPSHLVNGKKPSMEKISPPSDGSYSNILKIAPKPENNFRRTANLIMNTIVVDSPQDKWKREEHGGVKMWVNENGEVTVRKQPQRQKSITYKNRRSFTLRKSLQQPTERGTASLLYDQNEVDELFQMLDHKSIKESLNR